MEPLRDADDSAASAALQRLGGVGRWSAEYALLRGLGRLEVFPGDDVGARNNLARRLGLASPLDYDDVRQAVAPWAPYAGLAYFHLLAERIDAAGWLDGGDAPGDSGDVSDGSAEVPVRRRRRQQPAKPRIRG